MIGSPASRGATASLGGGAGRACPATAAAVSAVRAAIGAAVARTGGPEPRIAAVDWRVENRLNMPGPVEEACSRLRRSSVRSRLFGLNRRQHATNSLLGTIGRFDGNSIYTTAHV